MTFALYFVPDAYSLKGKIMGRQSAGASFLRAVADARLPHIFAFTRDENTARALANELAALGAPRTGVGFISLDQPARLAQAGLLYRPDPGIGRDAWRRHASGMDRAWSVCGITHTISTHAAMEAIAGLLTAPLEPWDALILTSRAAQEAVRSVLELQAEHLRERLGASRLTLPQLPVIPLGTHTAEFDFDAGARGSGRQSLGIADDEVAVLFAGRLVPHGKAHPLPMYRALEQAAQGRRVVLIQAGIAPNESMARIFKEEPARLCPSVRLINVDGADFFRYRQAWASADIFTSLSDGFQETQGLTPIEAMAAGLPAVVTDWNGYRDSVRDGVDGFRVPTLTLPPGMGDRISDRYDLGLDSFDLYSGLTGQLVAADITAAAHAYERLIDDAGLRRRMGEAGRVRARESYDWSVIFRRYQDLWANIADIRRGAPRLLPPLSRRRAPDRADPFAMFASHPTHAVEAETHFRPTPGSTHALVKEYQALQSINFAQSVLPPIDITDEILNDWSDKEWRSFDSFVSRFPQYPVAALAAAMVWLTKVGILNYQPAAPSE